MIIDIHTHTFPSDVAAKAIPKLEAGGGSKAFTDGTPDGLTKSMREAGVDHCVILQVATNPVKTKHINDVSIALTGRDNRTYFGCMHPDTPDALEELERIAKAGLKGIKIHPVYQDVPIDDPRYLRILEKAGELDLLVLMHAGRDIGFLDRDRCAPAMTRRAVRAVGPVKLICAHMGGWQNWDSVAENLADLEHVYIDTALTIGRINPIEGAQERLRDVTDLMTPERFMEVLRAFDPGRVLFGSDSPWSSQKESVEKIMRLPIDEQLKADILGNNAQRLLKLT